MAVTAADLQRIVIDEVGDVDPATGDLQPPLMRTVALTAAATNPRRLLARQIGVLWDSYADKALIAPRLQELYTRRRCIDLVRGAIADAMQTSAAGITLAKQQRIATLGEMRTDVQTEIERLERGARSRTRGAVGTLTAVEPVNPATAPPFNVPPDASDPRYGGWPYGRTSGPRG